jgi:transcriptional regulator with GAF, ATPase, and Fis domain
VALGRLPAEGHAGDASLPTLDQAQQQSIERALAATRGRIEGPHGAAALLKINPHTLRARMRKLGLDWSLFRRPAV